MPDMLLPLRRYADFRGRSRRAEFWWFWLFMLVAYGVAMVLDTVLGLGGQINRYADAGDGSYYAGAWGRGGILTLALFVLTFVPNLAVGVRRLHDANKSGFWLLIGIVPFIGGLVLLIFWVQPSWPQDNRWGGVPAT